MTATEIYDNHINNFFETKFMSDAVEATKHKTFNDFANYLREGNISMVLFNKCAQKTLSSTSIIGLYGLYKFPSERVEKMFRTAFIKQLRLLGIE